MNATKTDRTQKPPGVCQLRPRIRSDRLLNRHLSLTSEASLPLMGTFIKPTASKTGERVILEHHPYGCLVWFPLSWRNC